MARPRQGPPGPAMMMIRTSPLDSPSAHRVKLLVLATSYFGGSASAMPSSPSSWSRWAADAAGASSTDSGGLLLQLDPSHSSPSRAVFTVFAAEDGIYPSRLLMRSRPSHSHDEGDIEAPPPPAAAQPPRVNGRRLAPPAEAITKITAGHSSNVGPHRYMLPLRRGLNTVEVATRIAASLQLHVTDRLGEAGLTAGGAEASLGPFSTLEAEDALCHGGVVIGPSYDSYAATPHLAAEASGRRACQLQKPGDYVEFTAPTSFNALSVRASIPDAPQGGGQVMPILIAVGGAKPQRVNLTSAYSWYYGSYPFSSKPSQGKAHHFFDETRTLLPGSTFAAGTKVRLAFPAQPPLGAPSASCDLPFQQRRDCGFVNITAAQCEGRGCCYSEEPPAPNPGHIPWCYHQAPHPSPSPPAPPPPPPGGSYVTVDLLDLYDVAPPLQPPAGAVDVTAHGADPTGRTDSARAFVTAFAAAAGQGDAAVWIPEGTFTVGSILKVPDRVKIHGAGPWYSVVRGAGERVGQGAVGFYAGKSPGSLGIGLHDFSIIGDVRERCDSCQVNGVGGAPSGGSTIQNLWIQHTKCGLWLDGPGNDLLVTDVIVRDTTADGINLHTGWSGVTIAFNSFRNTGDDGIALWSDKVADFNNTVMNNIVQVPVLANGIAVYGGHDNTVMHNYVSLFPSLSYSPSD
jgi:hypothetical protein